MTPDRWHQIETLFDQAASLEGEARAAFLDEACAGDDDLRDSVEGMLAVEVEATGYFTELSDTVAVSDEAPERIGPWRLGRLLGEGGMGRVYHAERADGQFEQTAALKLVLPGLIPALVARFRAERQILARLDHPGIARLLDGGVTEPAVGQPSRPYLVMEYVEGEPITTYCDRRQLPIGERLALFEKVCEVVAYAHRNLVVHRDIKPSNVLVTAEGQVKLLDFGIAKLLDEDAPFTPSTTQTEHRLMTPEYAAPEQILGLPMTTATDVYALGVLLYALLTGHRPYRLLSRVRHTMERAILEDDPIDPSTVVVHTETWTRADGSTASITPETVSAARSTEPQRLKRRLRGDLDRIVRKALRKEPERRYASAEALGRDIGRHLNELPIEARPDTVGYRVGKFVRRHRAGVAAATLAVLLLVAALGVALWQAGRVTRERDRAVRATEMIVEFLGGVDPTQEGGRQISSRDLLDQMAERVDRDLGEEPATRAAMQAALGEVYANLGLFEPAERLLRAALTTRLDLFGPNHPDVQDSRITLGTLLANASHYAEGDRLLHEALAIRTQRFGVDGPAVAEAQHALGVSLTLQGRFTEAEPLLRAALAERRQLPPDAPELADTHAAMGQLLRRLGRLGPALLHYRAAAEGYRAHYGPRHALLGAALNEIGVILKNEGDYDAALPYYTEALDIFREVYGEEHPEYAFALANLGLLYKDQGLIRSDPALFDRAQPLLEQALETQRRLHADAHILVAHSEAHMGMLALARGDGYAAERWLRQSLVTHDAAQTPRLHTARPYPLTGLGEALMLQGRHVEAEAPLREALRIREAATAGHWRIAEAKSALGECLTHLNRLPEARTLLDESRSLIATGAGEAARLSIVTQAREALLRQREQEAFARRTGT